MEKGKYELLDKFDWNIKFGECHETIKYLYDQILITNVSFNTLDAVKSAYAEWKRKNYQLAK